MTRVLGLLDRPAVIAFGFIVILLILGGIYNQQFLSGYYLLQQLRVASFLGIIASGAMVVILLGHIDLSIPWVVTLGGIAATAVAGWWSPSWTALGVPWDCFRRSGRLGQRPWRGVLTHPFDGVHAGDECRRSRYGRHVYRRQCATRPGDPDPAVLAVRETLYVPHAVVVWALVGVLVIVALKRTPFGRYVYAAGNSERVTYLSGISTRTILMLRS